MEMSKPSPRFLFFCFVFVCFLCACVRCGCEFIIIPYFNLVGVGVVLPFSHTCHKAVRALLRIWLSET